MALSTKKYFILIFLVAPVALSLYAQNSVKKPTVPAVSICEMTALNNQNTDIADTTTAISNLDNSNQFLVRLSNPKDSLAKATETKDQTTIIKCDESLITASYSALAKDIIENYKYDFSETFIDILFFENIDLARKRTI